MIAMVLLLIVPNFCLYVFLSRAMEQTYIVKWGLCACFEKVWTHKLGTISKKTLLNIFLAKMIQTVFLLIVPNLLFICFSFQTHGTEIYSKIIYVHFFEIGWTHKPGTISTETVYLFLFLSIEMEMKNCHWKDWKEM